MAEYLLSSNYLEVRFNKSLQIFLHSESAVIDGSDESKVPTVYSKALKEVKAKKDVFS
ncbi:hypothetical protein J2Z23_003053 [Lederbergia galactosidilyticus]|uniref:hypothetical protein n=1 Tax=Lederbergia galactosidilytica TaxID=217031 RepID=UPI000B0FB247|nr:hypothetical protein [Lederbergia galactosidilytica]MBP1916071.1 hypothetical protein [Lederbergia galactosidilytica]